MDSELSKAVVNREEEETKISQEPKAETATAEKPEVIQHTTPSTDQNPKIEGSGSKNSPVSTGLVDEKKTGLEQDQVQPGKSENRASQGSSQQPDSPISRHPSQAQRRSTGGSRRRSRLSSVSGASNFSRSKSIAALSGQQSVFNKRESEHQEFIKENTPRPTNDGSLVSFPSWLNRVTDINNVLFRTAFEICCNFFCSNFIRMEFRRRGTIGRDALSA